MDPLTDHRFVARRAAARTGIAAALLLSSMGQAHAQSAADKTRAQDLQKQGMRLLEKGDSRGALKDFEEAIRLFPSPKILFNMGLAHKALGQEVDAVNDFERFLDEAPYAPKQSRDMAEKIIGEIRPRLSYLEIGTEDVGSHISIDGHEVGVAPLPRPLAVAPGAHEIRLEKTDMKTATRSVTPVPGQKLRVFVTLRPLAEVQPAIAAAPHPPVASEPQPPPPPPKIEIVSPPRLHETDDTPPPTAGPGRGRRALKWVAWGAALAGAGLGVYGAVQNSSLVDNFNNGCGLSGGMVITDKSGNKTLAQCMDLKKQYESAGQLGVIGFIGAGALAAAGFVFWFTEPSSAPTNQVGLASCVPALSATLEPSVSCALRF